ncbi:MAG TPA: FHA domain-containing protein, partial [Vineibacter sp.]|nr:FHA domain-containing protein [Vineibacter sp.]
PEASIGNPHARLHLAQGRLGLEDLGSQGGTAIDGAQLLPSHGIREVTQSKRIRFGALEFALARS